MLFFFKKYTDINKQQPWQGRRSQRLESPESRSPVSSHLPLANKLLHISRQQLQMLWVTLRQKAGLPSLIGEKKEKERGRGDEMRGQNVWVEMKRRKIFGARVEGRKKDCRGKLEMAKEMAENCHRRRDRKRGGGHEMRWLGEEMERIR